MKARYIKPTIEFEEYELNTAIATGCHTVVSLGPGDDTHKTCDEYNVDIYRIMPQMEPPQQINFYEDSCTCYLSAGTGTLFTS